MARVYSTKRWNGPGGTRELALERDARRCTVARLLGGDCSPDDVPLEAHHIVPVEEGGAPYDLDNVGTTCKRHHPTWESLRRTIARRRLRLAGQVECPHFHPTSDGRRVCERRLARRLTRAA